MPQIPLRTAVPVLLLFCVTTPLGVLVGVAVDAVASGSASLVAQALMQGFASGSFLYLTSHETAEEPPVPMPSWEKLLLLSAGSGVMAGLAAVV